MLVCVSVSSTKTKRKRGDSSRVEGEEDGDKKKKKETARPNYFVSVPITNLKVRAGDRVKLTVVVFLKGVCHTDNK